jgi:hypothetical protein
LLLNSLFLSPQFAVIFHMYVRIVDLLILDPFHFLPFYINFASPFCESSWGDVVSCFGRQSAPQSTKK